MNTCEPILTPCRALQQQTSWPRFWNELNHVLIQHRYAHGSRRLYRSVLRALVQHAGSSCPRRLTAAAVDTHLKSLVTKQASASWTAMNISVLRTIFDKACGLQLLAQRCGPRRRQRLPYILTPEQVAELLRSTASPRDVLLLGLLYGCGLRPGEALQLRWQNIHVAAAELHTRQRVLPLPRTLLACLEQLSQCTKPEDWVFPGRQPQRHLALRSLHRIVQRAAHACGFDIPVTPMTLRHSFAVHQLQAGMHLRELQEQLGHASIETTMRYQTLVPPAYESPADQLPELVIPEVEVNVLEHPFAQTHEQAPWLQLIVKQPLKRMMQWLRRYG